MSGVCSRHQGHDPLCSLCLAVPLTDLDKAYYKGWDFALESTHRNGWVFTEAHVMDAFEELEAASRALVSGGAGEVGELQEKFAAVASVVAKIDELRRLKRGFRA
jgi:hypothetical protein